MWHVNIEEVRKTLKRDKGHLQKPQAINNQIFISFSVLSKYDHRVKENLASWFLSRRYFCETSVWERLRFCHAEVTTLGIRCGGPGRRGVDVGRWINLACDKQVLKTFLLSVVICRRSWWESQVSRALVQTSFSSHKLTCVHQIWGQFQTSSDIRGTACKGG